MSKTYDFSEAKAAKEGVITPKGVIDNLVDWMENNPNKIKKLVVGVLLEDGIIETAISDMEFTEAVGLFEIAKAITIERMDEEI